VPENYEMTNFDPVKTGLPMPISIILRGGSAKIKIGSATLGVKPKPHVLSGTLAPKDERLVFQWITLNIDLLLAHWNGQIDTAQLGRKLKRV